MTTVNNSVSKAEDKNRVSIISFATDAKNLTGSNFVLPDSQSAKNAVNNLSAYGVTRTSKGIALANTIVNSHQNDRKKVVIFFTDGQPTNSSGNVSTTEASDTIYSAKNLKDKDVSIYTVMMDNEKPKDSSNQAKFMNYLSSNYPKATGLNSPGSGTWNGSYYNAATDAASLQAIFEKISQEVNKVDLNESTIVRDTMSVYFKVNTNKIGDIKLYTAKYLGNGNYANKVQISSNGKVKITNNVVDVSGYKFDPIMDKNKDGKVSGEKLIIEIPVAFDEDSIVGHGGEEVNSNATDSGIINDGTMIRNFDSPKVVLPKSTLEVKAKDGEKTYDGKALTAGYTVEGKLKDGDKVVVTNTSSITNVGETDNKFDSVKIMRGNEDVTSKYNLQTKPGKLKVTRKEVTIKVKDASKMYGEKDPTFKEEITGGIGNDLQNIKLTFKRTNTAEAIGNYPNVLTISNKISDLENKYKNYKFKVINGNFSITENTKDLAVKADNVEKTYDGQSYGVKAKATINGKEDKSVTIKYYNEVTKAYDLNESPKYKNVGKYTVKFEASKAGYKTVTKSATVTIDKAPVTITVDNKSKQFGEADPDFSIKEIKGIITGELTDIDLSVKRTNTDEAVGTYNNVLTTNLSKEDYEKAYTNYTFTINNGDFTIKTNESALKVEAEKVTKTYDGNAYGVNAVASIEGATIKYMDSNGKYILDKSPVRKDVGTTTVKFKAFKEGYKEATGEATITITKKTVTITVGNNSKQYGEADPAFANATISGQVNGELTDIDLSVKRTNTKEDVGTYKNVLTTKVSKADYEKAYTNYTFTINNGDFTIKTNTTDLDASADEVKKVYNATAYGISPVVTIKGKVTDKATIRYKDANGKYTLTTSPTRTDVGETTIEYEVSLKGYNKIQRSQKVIITPRPVTITVGNNSKAFGTNDPTNTKVKMEGHINNELTQISLKVIRTNTDEAVGNYSKVLTIVGDNVVGNDVTELNKKYTNYTFTINNGDFTITTNENDLTVTAKDVIETYNGNAYGVNAVASIEGATIKYMDENGEYTLDNSPTYTNVTNGAKAINFEASKAGYKTVTGTATVTINKAPVTITVGNNSKQYGEADPAFANATIDGQVSGELTDIDLSVKRTNTSESVGTYKNVLTTNVSKEDYEKAYTNYTFTINNGDFEIKENTKDLSVTATNYSDTYDGQSHGIDATASIKDATIKYMDENGEYTLDKSPVRKDVGVHTVKFKASLYGYTDALNEAKITINKKGVNITVADVTKEYGKDEEPFNNAVMSGNIAGELGDIDLTVRKTVDTNPEEVKTYENILQISKTKAELDARYTNYVFTVGSGNYTITNNTSGLSVKAPNIDTTYDGNNHITEATAGIKGATITYGYTKGNYTMNKAPTYKDVTNGKLYFKASLYGYDDAEGEADIIIRKREVSIKVGTLEKQYGEEDPLFANAELSNGVGNELDKIDLSVRRTNANVNELGTYKDVLQIKSSKSDLENTYTNYIFNIDNGDFIISENKTALKVSAPNINVTYDGKAHSTIANAGIEGATIKYMDENGNYTLDTCPTLTNVGSINVKFEASLHGYTSAKGEATITVNKRNVTILIANAEKFDNENDPKFANASMSGEVTGELKDIDLSIVRNNANVNEVGKYENVLTIKSTKEELENKYTNYNFEIIPGSFTIKKAVEKTTEDTTNKSNTIQKETNTRVYKKVKTGDNVSITTTLIMLVLSAMLLFVIRFKRKDI